MGLQIGFLTFPNLQQLSLTGAYEVFASLPDTSVHLVAERVEPVGSVTGLTLSPTIDFAECPPLDVLCIPGGRGVNALLKDEEALDFVRRQGGAARRVVGICSGTIVLGAAGLLKGRRATTHWASHDLLGAFGAIPTQGRIVRDGNLVTAGGVTAGIDLALTLAAELAGADAAKAIQLHFEYAPSPPFDSGRPESASPEVLAQAWDIVADARQDREEIIAEMREEPPRP